jgi:hypothetical protein
VGLGSPGPRALLLACAALVAAPAARGEQASVACRARRTTDRVAAAVEATPLLGEEARRLILLGMKGSLRVEATVVRRRFGLFEQTLGTASREAVLSAAPDGRTLLLDGRPLPAAGAVVLEGVAVRLSVAAKPGDALTFRAAVQLRVVTASSLAKVAAWATESNEDDAASSLLTRAVLQAVASDLTRSGECACVALGP